MVERIPGAGGRGLGLEGLNLDDGGALMAFRMRDKAGGDFWAGGALRDAAGRVRVFAPGEIRFAPLRRVALAADGRRLSGRDAGARRRRRRSCSSR